MESTRKITKAMEMVAASKLKRFQYLKAQAAPYEESLEGILKRLLRTDMPLTHPLLEQRKEKEAALLVITSDTGLCGSFNYSLVEETKKFLNGRAKTPLMIGFGKNGVNRLLSSGQQWHSTFTDTKTNQIEPTIAKIGLLMKNLFCEKKVDAVYVVFSHFISKNSFCPTVEKILPFPISDQRVSEEGASPYIIEPDAGTLFAKLIPLFFESKIRMIFLESFIAEQTARRNAMSQATENAEELIETLVLLRNKMRQAAITKELIEIVSGSRALKNK